jgi:hypothetical protein
MHSYGILIIMKKITNRYLLVFAILFIFSFSAPLVSSAAAKAKASYRYNRITADYYVQPDSSVKVNELETFLYDGTYNSAWRYISHGNDFKISDITMYDGRSGRELTYSTTTLDGANPDNWGKYTYFEDNGTTKIAWYYDTPFRVYTWVIRYTVRGAVGFNRDNDELEWTILEDFDVPVDTIEAEVHLPREVTDPQSKIFTTGGHDSYIDRPDRKTFRFRVSDVAVGEKVWLKVSWQKGIVRPNVPLLPAWLTQLFGGDMRYFIFGIISILALAFIEWRWKIFNKYYHYFSNLLH